MVGYRAALVLILGAAVAACATSPSLSQPQDAPPSGSPQITDVAPSHDPSPVAPPSVLPTPAPDPMTVKEAGAALLAAEGRLEEAWSALQDKYYLTAPCAYTSQRCNKTEMKAGKKYWATLAAALSRYIDELKAIRFPDIAAADANAHIKATDTFRDLALSASKATTVGTFNARAAAAADARDTTYGIQELKDALGLPVGP
jgi:hypothetical protein